MYATELVQCCHRRGQPTMLLKLDFAKAFDSVAWPCLMKVLAARGFPELWCTSIGVLLSTSRSAVMVNGCPGPSGSLAKRAPTRGCSVPVFVPPYGGRPSADDQI